MVRLPKRTLTAGLKLWGWTEGSSSQVWIRIPPGVAALSVGQLDSLTVTVFIPENKYGQINLGDLALLTSDSFPGQTFDATVVRIADRAEYTPRNVQTQEERVTTVYEIELVVNDSQGKLKPGMPADVSFQ